MVKQIVLLIVLSIIAVLFLKEVHQILNVLVYAFDKLTGYLSFIFAGDSLGRVARHVIALILIPVIIGLIVHLIYWAITRNTSTVLFAVIWCVWLVLVALLG